MNIPELKNHQITCTTLQYSLTFHGKKTYLKKNRNHQGSRVVAIILFKLWNSTSSSGSNTTLLSTGKRSFLWPTIMAATSLIYISCRRCQFLFKLEADLTELIRWKYCRATCSWTRTFVMPLADAYPQKSTFLFPTIFRAEPVEQWRVGVELKSQKSIIKVEIQIGVPISGRLSSLFIKFEFHRVSNCWVRTYIKLEFRLHILNFGSSNTSFSGFIELDFSRVWVLRVKTRRVFEFWVARLGTRFYMQSSLEIQEVLKP